MARLFLSETYPSAVFAEQAPGPGWTPACPATPPVTAARSTPVVEPRPLSPADMISALSAAMATIPATENPGDAFHRLAELRSRAEGCSLAEAYRRQSMSTPELWTDVRNAAPRWY